MNVVKEIRRAAKLNLLGLDIADAHGFSSAPLKAKAWRLMRRCDARCDVIALSIERHLNRTAVQVAEMILSAQDEIMMNRKQRPSYIK